MSTWYEIVVTGSAKVLRGFIAGFEAGRDVSDLVLLGEDLEVEGLPFAERLRGLVGGGPPHVVIAPERSGHALTEALKARGSEAELELRDVRVISGARFGFTARAFAPEVAARIRTALLESLPSGVALESRPSSAGGRPRRSCARLRCNGGDGVTSRSRRSNAPERKKVEPGRPPRGRTP
jgi:hypothetical protein